MNGPIQNIIITRSNNELGSAGNVSFLVSFF